MNTSTHVLGLFFPKFWVHSHHCRPYWRPLSTLGGNRRCAVWVLQALDACLLVACYTMITLTQLFGFFVLFWAYSSIQGVLQAPGGPWCTLGSTENSARTPIHHRNKQMMFNDVITTKIPRQSYSYTAVVALWLHLCSPARRHDAPLH